MLAVTFPVLEHFSILPLSILPAIPPVPTFATLSSVSSIFPFEVIVPLFLQPIIFSPKTPPTIPPVLY